MDGRIAAPANWDTWVMSLPGRTISLPEGITVGNILDLLNIEIDEELILNKLSEKNNRIKWKT